MHGMFCIHEPLKGLFSELVNWGKGLEEQPIDHKIIQMFCYSIYLSNLLGYGKWRELFSGMQIVQN